MENKLHHLGFVWDDDQLLPLAAVPKRGDSSGESSLSSLVGQSATQSKLDHGAFVLRGGSQHRSRERSGRIFDMPAVEHVVLGRHDGMQPHTVSLKHRDEQLLLVVNTSKAIELPDD